MDKECVSDPFHLISFLLIQTTLTRETTLVYVETYAETCVETRVETHAETPVEYGFR
jgi:hypothetical protein